MLKKIYTDRDVLNILFTIIDSTNAKNVNNEIDICINREIEKLSKSDSIQARKSIEELKRIPHYENGKGLGIGSLTSQILAIFYLNGIDHYIKETLGIKEYVRYMDDGIIFSSDKEMLKEVWRLLKIEIEKLKLNDKTAIFTSHGGFDFVGYRFIQKNGRLLIRVKNLTKNRMRRKFLLLSKYDSEKLIRVKASYKGIFKYCTTKSLYNKYFKN